MNLRVLTTDKTHHGGRHGYRCTCTECVAERAALTPAICACDRPAVFLDPTSGGEPNCFRCGRPAADQTLYRVAA